MRNVYTNMHVTERAFDRGDNTDIDFIDVEYKEKQKEPESFFVTDNFIVSHRHPPEDYESWKMPNEEDYN